MDEEDEEIITEIIIKKHISPYNLTTPIINNMIGNIEYKNISVSEYPELCVDKDGVIYFDPEEEYPQSKTIHINGEINLLEPIFETKKLINYPVSYQREYIGNYKKINVMDIINDYKIIVISDDYCSNTTNAQFINSITIETNINQQNINNYLIINDTICATISLNQEYKMKQDIITDNNFMLHKFYEKSIKKYNIDGLATFRFNKIKLDIGQIKNDCDIILRCYHSNRFL